MTRSRISDDDGFRGSELKAHFWIVEPRRQDFVKVAVRHNLRGGHYSLEGASFLG